MQYREAGGTVQYHAAHVTHQHLAVHHIIRHTPCSTVRHTLHSSTLQYSTQCAAHLAVQHTILHTLRVRRSCTDSVPSPLAASRQRSREWHAIALIVSVCALRGTAACSAVQYSKVDGITVQQGAVQRSGTRSRWSCPCERYAEKLRVAQCNRLIFLPLIEFQ